MNSLITRERLGDVLFALGSIAVTLLLWEGIVRYFQIPAFLVPPPSDVARALMRNADLYRVHLGYTLLATVIAFFVALVLGIAMGTLTAEVRLVERTFSPILIALQSAPRIALAPMVIVWFGFGITSKVVLGVFTAFFPVFLNVSHGLAAIDREQVRLMQSLGASPLQIFFKIKLPASLPFIFAGANIALIFAMLSVIVAEFVGSNRGMGYLIVNQSNQLDTTGVFASVTVLAGVGLVFHYTLQAVRRRLLFWATDSESLGSGL
ncbi:MAG: ABC transporter permease [Rhodobacter sp.]|nr:ABC transporter permease [Paracoccaceae bacterium]MCC0077340.1 ABC transporter permease [Rhodobacter sp.]